MPKRTNPFQQLIAMLVQLLKDSVVVEESKEFPDPDTGRPREVDVYALIRGKWDEEEITVAVECVDRKRKMDVTWVEMIYGKHSILQVGDVVLLVSRSGFWHSAEVKAKRFGYRTITPAISPKRLATEIGLAGDFRLSARAMTLRFGATTVDVNVPTHSHHWASGEHFQRSDGSELVEVQEFEVEVLKDELSKDESFHSDKRASEFTRRVTVDEPMFNGERLYAKFRSDIDQSTVRLPINSVSFTARASSSNMADFEQTELGEFDGHRIGTGVSMLDGKPSRMVVTETPDGRLKGLLRLNYETKNLEPILSDGPEQPADLDD